VRLLGVPWMGVEVPLQCDCIAIALQCSRVTKHIYGFYDLRVSTKAFAHAGTETPRPKGWANCSALGLLSFCVRRRGCEISRRRDMKR
jgi:hypothetical protein